MNHPRWKPAGWLAVYELMRRIGDIFALTYPSMDYIAAGRSIFSQEIPSSGRSRMNANRSSPLYSVFTLLYFYSSSSFDLEFLFFLFYFIRSFRLYFDLSHESIGVVVSFVDLFIGKNGRYIWDMTCIVSSHLSPLDAISHLFHSHVPCATVVVVGVPHSHRHNCAVKYDCSLYVFMT